MNKTSSTKKIEKHKFTTSCFNTCVEWKLNASLLHNKTSLGYVISIILHIQNFLGKSLFFKNLDASVLNTLQVNYSSDKNIMKEIEEKSNINLNEKTKSSLLDEKENDILNIKFPIDNSDFNFMIIDANLGISENLNNIFFLEFDLNNTMNNKDKMKILREINNECVEREIFFVLNVNIFS